MSRVSTFQQASPPSCELYTRLWDLLCSGIHAIVHTASSCLPRTRHSPVVKSHLESVK